MTKLDFSKMEGHTPGPWEWEPGGYGIYGISGPEEDDGVCRDIASVFGLNLSDVMLIAAAPDMKDEILRQREVIEKCKEVIEHVLGVVDRSDHWWMDCPDRGGFDIEKLQATLKEIKGDCND